MLTSFWLWFWSKCQFLILKLNLLFAGWKPVFDCVWICKGNAIFKILLSEIETFLKLFWVTFWWIEFLRLQLEPTLQFLFAKPYQLQKLHEKVQNFPKKSCSLDDKKFGYDK